MALPTSVNDRKWMSYGEDDTATAHPSEVLVKVGGVVASGQRLVAYSNGDECYFNFDNYGRLKTILEGATFVISGNQFEVDVSAFQDSSGNRKDAYVFNDGESLAGVAEYWQAVGGYDATSGVFRALPIATDNIALPADAHGFPIIGEYNSTLPTYDSGDAVIFQLDDRGRLITAVELNDYVDKSNEFTSGTSKMLAVGGVVLGGSITDGDVGVFAMSNERELHVDITSLSGMSSATLTSDVETVAAPATAEPLNGGVSLPVTNGFKTVVKALTTNTGVVYVGSATTASSASGLQLYPGESVSLAMQDVATIYVDVDTGGEGVSWIVESAV